MLVSMAAISLTGVLDLLVHKAVLCVGQLGNCRHQVGGLVVGGHYQNFHSGRRAPVLDVQSHLVLGAEQGKPLLVRSPVRAVLHYLDHVYLLSHVALPPLGVHHLIEHTDVRMSRGKLLRYLSYGCRLSATRGS